MNLSTLRNILIGIYVLAVLAFSAVAKAETVIRTSNPQLGCKAKA